MRIENLGVGFVLKFYDCLDLKILRSCLKDIFLMVLKKGNKLRKIRKHLNYFKIPAANSNPVRAKIQDEYESIDIYLPEKVLVFLNFRKESLNIIFY